MDFIVKSPHVAPALTKRCNARGRGPRHDRGPHPQAAQRRAIRCSCAPVCSVLRPQPVRRSGGQSADNNFVSWSMSRFPQGGGARHPLGHRSMWLTRQCDARFLRRTMGVPSTCGPPPLALCNRQITKAAQGRIAGRLGNKTVLGFLSSPRPDLPLTRPKPP